MELKEYHAKNYDGLELNDIRIIHLKTDEQLTLCTPDINRPVIAVNRLEAEFLAAILLHFANTGELLSDVDTPKDPT